MKTFDIAVPRSAVDLRIKHYKVLQLPQQVFSDHSIEGKISFVSALTGTKQSDLKLLTVDQLNDVWNHGMMAFSGFKVNPEPPKEITLDGKTYERIDPKKVSSAWHIDWSALCSTNPLEKNPVMLASMFYFPKGEKYGEVDGNENLLNPIKERYEVFKEHMPLQTFVESLAFFLKSWHVSTKKYTDKRRAQEWTMEKLQPMLRTLGRKQ